jgi:DNA mismatch endonuclease, patch repair protein
MPPKKFAVSAEGNLKSKLHRNSTLAGRDRKAATKELSSRPDHLDEFARSALMARVRRSGTAPELKVRKAARELGFRFRVNESDLPGRPDIVFPQLRSVVFVHGCFWHRHKGCRRASTPATRTDYWLEKFARNTARDERVKRELRKAKWSVLVIWSCELDNLNRLSSRLAKFLERRIPKISTQQERTKRALK